MIIAGAVSLGNITSVTAKAETINNSFSVVKNLVPSIKNILAENGEQELNEAEYNLINAEDKRYLEEKSQDIPSEKFTITTDEAIPDSGEVKVKWTGHAEDGNKVSMYAWNVKTSAWDKLCGKYTHDNNDFTMEKEIIKGDYNDNNNIHIKVQSESQDDDEFSFGWITDTQFYAQSYPDIFNTEVNYILKNRNTENIKYVVHTGDIINNMEQGYQWVNADNSLKIFDNAAMPYGVLAGNHDVVYNKNVDYSTYKKFFGEDRYKKNSWYGGSYEDNRGHYDLLSEDGNDFIVVYMGWQIGEEEYKWMNEVLAEHKDRKAILCFHKYLTPDGERDEAGEGVYNNVVLKNPNVSIVLCGHYTGASNKINEIDDNNDGIADRTVYEILCDYQGAENGGNGYLRLMKFNGKSKTLDINTYSPKLDDYNYYDNNESEKNSLGYKDEFSIPLDLNRGTKVLATDSFTVEGNKADTASTAPVTDNNDNNKGDSKGDSRLDQSDDNLPVESVKADEKGDTKYSATAKTGDMYSELIAMIILVSVSIMAQEIKLRKVKKINH